jgi:autotransporter-associated beta strand protein/probable HAF family extracellular repeat protein
MSHGLKICVGVLCTVIASNSFLQDAWCQPRQTYSISDLGLVYDTGSHQFLGQVNGINEYGDIVGGVEYNSTGANIYHGFLYSGGVIQDMGEIGGYQYYNWANSISNEGRITGVCGPTGYPYDPPTRAFTGPVGSYSILNGMTEGYSINDNRQVLGWGDGSSQPSGGRFSNPVLYDNGSYVDIESLVTANLNGTQSFAWGLNQAGQISGYYVEYVNSLAYPRAFVYNEGNVSAIVHNNNVITLSGSLKTDLNNKGEVVGGYVANEFGQGHAFVYSNGAFTDIHSSIPDSEYFDTEARSINDKGQIVGSVGYHAFLYTTGNAVQIGECAGSGFPMWINSLGQVLVDGGNYGAYVFSGGSKTYLQDLINGSWGGTWQLENYEQSNTSVVGDVKTTMINDSGQITGIVDQMLDENGNPVYVPRAFIMTPGLWKSTGGAGQGWGNANNWDVADLPQYVGDIATFGTSIGSTNTSVNLDGDRTLSGLVFNNAGGSYTITSGTQYPNGKLILDNTNGSVAIITVLKGSHAIASPLQVNCNYDVNVYSGATLSISGSISESGGAKSLTKSGLGTLVLTGTNSCTGAATISGGTLQVGNGGTTGTLPSGNVVNDGKVSFNRSNSITISNTISGTGSVEHKGTGTLTLSGTNTYSGGTVLNGGTLVVNSNSNLGALSGALSLYAGTFKPRFYTSYGEFYNRTINWGMMNLIRIDNEYDFAVREIGARYFQKDGPGTLRIEGFVHDIWVTDGVLAVNGNMGTGDYLGIAGGTVSLEPEWGQYIYNPRLAISIDPTGTLLVPEVMNPPYVGYIDGTGTIDLYTSLYCTGYDETLTINLNGYCAQLYIYDPRDSIRSEEDLSPVPEPTGLVLLVAGAAMVLACPRLRKRLIK